MEISRKYDGKRMESNVVIGSPDHRPDTLRALAVQSDGKEERWMQGASQEGC